MAGKKKATTKKKDLESLSQTHGMVEEKVKNPTTLAQIWGDTGIEKYKTLDKEQYSEYLHSLNKSDLQAHAQTVGLVPIDSPKMLRERLEKEFKKHVAAYKAPNPLNNPKEVSEEVKKILSEGR